LHIITFDGLFIILYLSVYLFVAVFSGLLTQFHQFVYSDDIVQVCILSLYWYIKFIYCSSLSAWFHTANTIFFKIPPSQAFFTTLSRF